MSLRTGLAGVEAGVYVTEQVAELPLPDSMHDPPFENEPGPPLAVETVPVGVFGSALSASLTVAVQVVEFPAITDAAEQLTLVAVAFRLATCWQVIAPPRACQAR